MAIVGSKETIGGREVAILVEVDQVPDPESEAWLAEGDVARGARLDKVLDAVRDVFGDGLALASDCAARAAEVYVHMDEPRPDGFELQLAIKLDAEAGAVVTKIGAGAQMQVTMRWERSAKQ